MGEVYAQPNIITFDSKEYLVTSGVDVQPVEPWSIGMRQGSPEYEHREHASFRSWESLAGGLGLDIGSARNYPDRWWEGEGVRTWNAEGDWTLGPLVNTGGISGLGATGGGDFALYPLGAQDDTYLFFGRGSEMYKKLSTSAWVVETTGLSFAAVHDLTTFRNDEGGNHYNTMMAAFGSANDFGRYRNSVWDNPTNGHGNSSNGWSYEKADDFLAFENKILKMFYGEIQVSLDGATWTDVVAVPGNTTFMAFFAGVGVNGVGDLVPYAVAEGKLFAIDIWTHQKVEIETGMSQSITHAITWQDGEVVLTDGYTVKAYHPDRPVRSLGFDELGHGLGTENDGVIKSLMVVQGKYLIAAVERGGATVQLFLWQGGGWHNLCADMSGIWTGTGVMLGYYNGGSLFSPLHELWCITSTGSYYLRVNGFRRRFPVYAASGYVRTTDFDGGFAEVEGTALELECFASALTASDETVVVKYGLNGAAPTTTLGTFTNAVTRIKFASGAGIAFKSIRFEYTLTRGATTSKTPIVHAIVFKYLKVPALRRRISFTVDLERTARHRSPEVESETVLDELMTLISATTLKVLTWVGEGNYYVKVVTMPRRDYQESQTTVTKTGLVRVEVVQPVED